MGRARRSNSRLKRAAVKGVREFRRQARSILSFHSQMRSRTPRLPAGANSKFCPVFPEAPKPPIEVCINDAARHHKKQIKNERPAKILRKDPGSAGSTAVNINE